MMKLIKISLLILSLFSSFTVLGQTSPPNPLPIQVIVNKNSELISLNRQQIVNLFLGRARSFPNGKQSKTFDYKMGSTLRQNFFEWLTGKNISDIDAYWARLRYSGRMSPPKEISNIKNTLAMVRKNPNAIAYIRQQDSEHLAKQGIVVVHTIRSTDAH